MRPDRVLQSSALDSEIVGGTFRAPEDEYRFLAQRERTLRLQMAIVHVGVALPVCAGMVLDLARLSGTDLTRVLACRVLMLTALLGSLAWSPRLRVERLGPLMVVALAVVYVGFGVIATTFLRSTGRSDYVLLLGGSAALLLPTQIAPARKCWPLLLVFATVAIGIGSVGGLPAVDVAWNAFTVTNLALLGLLLNYLWNTNTRTTFLAQERAVRAEAELRRLREAEARAAKQALDRREDEWEAILRAAPVVLNIIDSTHTITFSNGAALELGLRPNGNLLKLLCRDEGRLQPRDPFSPVFASGRVARFECHVGEGDDGRALSFSAAPIGGEPYERAVVVGIDRSEAHRLSEALHQAQKLQTVGSLAGSVAHDFNNLLTVISSAVELLAEEPVSEEGAALLDEVRLTTSHAAGLTRQLLIFSRRQPVRPRNLDLSAVVRDTAPLLERILGPESTLRLQLAEGLPAVSLDLTHGEQILLNVTVNARDAMPRGGDLLVSTRRVTGGVELRMRDAGPGFSSDDVERVFEPFFTTKSRGHGTGLGLPTVKGIVEAAGGTVSARNASGGGAEIVVVLPEAGQPAQQPREEAPPAAAGRDILVVDDSEEVLRLTARVLERAGHRVHRAQSLEEARAVLETLERLDALVCDVRLKGARGTAVDDAARARFSAVSVLYVSGFVDDEQVLARVRRGEALLLDKPFTSRALVGALERSLGAADGPASPGSATA